MRVKLKDGKKGKKQITYTKKDDLYAQQCDCCGKIFDMIEFCNDKQLAYMSGTFDRGAADSNGKGLGNMFSATICSFKCADTIFNGGWKEMKGYKPYKKEGATLVRASLKITSNVIEEDDIVENWKNRPDRDYNTITFSGGAFFTGGMSEQERKEEVGRQALHTTEALIAEIATNSSIPTEVIERLRIVSENLSSFENK